MSAGEGGASGQFFFCSHDNRFIIKTLNQNEMKIFKRMMFKYHYYLNNNQYSYIAKIYGLFEIQIIQLNLKI